MKTTLNRFRHMKMTHYLFIVLMAGTLALAGCGKSSKETPAPRQPGVVDLGPLQQAFPDATPDVKGSLDKLRFSARYGQLEAELVELDKLIAIPNLTEPQKKAVNDVIEQVKAAIQARPAAPAQ
jgi:uncharacterized membrane-anchored protein